MPTIMPPIFLSPEHFHWGSVGEAVEKGSLKPKTKTIMGLLNWIKGHERCHPEKKVKQDDAGLKIEGLCGNMEGRYAFTCKIQKL